MSTDAAPPRDRPFTIKELAERWNCSTETVLRRIRKGELPCIELGHRSLLVPANDVMALESALTVRRGSKPQGSEETHTQSTGLSPGPNDARVKSPEAVSSQRARLRRHARGTH
jgi:excisionase family DNA binding protein